MSIQFFKTIQMQYLLAIYLAWFLTIGHFTSVPLKLSLSNLIYVVIMMPSLWILLSIIHGGKSVKGIENVEIKAEQNHTFKSLFEVFSDSQDIDIAVRNTFLLFCMKAKTQPALITTSEELAIFNACFCNCVLCQFSDI